MPIEIEGVSELSDLLANEAPAAARRYLKKVADPAAKVMLDAAAGTVPVRYGVLQAGLTTQTNWSSGDDGVELAIRIGPGKRQFWGTFLEFGTKASQGIVRRGRHAGKWHFNHAATPARHWMLRAWEASQQKMLDVFVEGAKEMIATLRARQAKP